MTKGLSLSNALPFDYSSTISASQTFSVSTSGQQNFAVPRLVAGTVPAMAQDIDIGKAHMAMAHILPRSRSKSKRLARLVTMVAARTQLVHAAHADTRTLATRRAERLPRQAGAALASVLMVNHVEAGLDGKASRLILLVGIIAR